jgi:hypothetical protein
MQLAPRPPIEDHHSKIIGMQGEFPPNRVRPRIDPQKWSQRPDVIRAYDKLQKQHGLERVVWDKAIWPFMAFCSAGTTIASSA